ncbi:MULTISPECIES: FAD-dependent oxidoreductase [unclassified Arthrobacter]|uniref:oxidoreductase n=1 Tax=unclassified Arthrobacter TaxID=235627 RepID=UPI001E593444|nr:MULTISPECIES: FAD-dependent oxidoreductase [unclassified Arthrobacter]MCC9144890.1 FAD-dependent oxidoreductase [Arthrobacter sp. zg-Y919]MDK1276116.1 FAD-dependent oxidoreductase [Arthrobacter sp. zg.Y919]WIB02543.1 FAD-dependent oxidoreductase [Arthrobacter sp. zg-Y919]
MLDRVFSPVSLGPLRLDHRIVMGSMHLNREEDPLALAAFYRERAAGGAGLIVTGGAAVNRAGAGGANYLLINEPGAAALMSPVLDAVHEAGGRLALQLFHAGRYAWEATYGIRPTAPSEIYSDFSRCLPRALTSREVEDTVGDFAAGAAAARALGFDAVEIMGSEGYLINQFASPLTNRRQDRWGGDPQRRQSFPLAVLQAVREAVGAAYPVIYRTSGADFVTGSSTREESRDLAVALAVAGADALNIGIGWHESRVPTVQGLVPHGRWMEIAGGIRNALAAAGQPVPVIGSNRINSLELAERSLAAGHADLVSMARPFLADPAIVAKTRRGESNLVNTCIACNEACIDRSMGAEPVSCLVNPRAGRETEFPLPPRPDRRRVSAPVRVAVVGAGPAGMQAAATLAQWGHPVDLYERDSSIGGQFQLAGRVPGKEDFLQTIRYFRNELARLGVRVLTGAPPGAGDLAGYAHVVLATGVLPRPVPLPGAGLLPVLDYRQAFADVERLGARVVIVGAGGIGVDLSRLLSDPRVPGGPRIVTILRRGIRIGEGIGPSTRWAVLQDIRAAGVRTLSGTVPLSVTPKGLRVRDRTGGRILPADAVVLAAGQVPHNPLQAQLEDRGMAFTVAGGALDATGLNAVRAFEQGLSAGTTVARLLSGRTRSQRAGTGSG